MFAYIYINICMYLTESMKPIALKYLQSEVKKVLVNKDLYSSFHFSIKGSCFHEKRVI